MKNELPRRAAGIRLHFCPPAPLQGDGGAKEGVGHPWLAPPKGHTVDSLLLESCKCCSLSDEYH